MLSAICHPPSAISQLAQSPAVLYNRLMPDVPAVATAWLNIINGQSSPETPPGFAVLTPPRKTARGREKDALLVCLHLRARQPVSAQQYAKLVGLATTTFYATAGTVTAALRQVVTQLNQQIFEHNRQSAPLEQNPLQGSLVCAALRGDSVYAAQCGNAVLVVARPAGGERFPTAPTRALGTSNAADPQYFHTSLGPGDYLALSQQLPKGWTDPALVGLGNLTTLSLVVERLKELAEGEAVAWVGRVETNAVAAPLPTVNTPAAPSAAGAAPGGAKPAGLSSFLRIKRPPAAEEPTAPPVAAAPAPADIEPTTTPQPAVARQPAEPTPTAPAQSAADSQAVTDWHNLIRRAEQLRQQKPTATAVATEVVAPPTPAAAPPPAPAVIPTKPATTPTAPVTASTTKTASTVADSPAVRAVGRAVGVTATEGARGLRVLLARLLPADVLQKEGQFNVPESVWLGAAVFIPAVIVALALWMFFEYGTEKQFTDALSSAQQAVAQGRQVAAQDPVQARPYWETALHWVTLANGLRPMEAEVEALRREAQTALDQLDWVTRVEYRPLIPEGLGESVQIRQILLVGEDVYALDEAQNRVLRLTPSIIGGGIYSVDSAFRCSGNQAVGEVRVGKLIDLVLIPGPNLLSQASTLAANAEAIVAVDTMGALLYCAPGVNTPLASYLTAPDLGWVRPTALETYADRLYVLDPGSNQVVQYQASGGAFTQNPVGYFTSVAYDLSDVIEFAIAEGNVFLLRKDGRVASCSRTSTEAPATCVEVVQFDDPRPGQSSGEHLAGVTTPLRLVYNAPPEPSLYLLDTQGSAIYQLSLKLAFVAQFRPNADLGEPVVSLGIDTSKQFFLATTHNVYVAKRP